MRHFTPRFKKNWHVFSGTRRSQAAEMVIQPGDSEGGPGNRHPHSDQWLFVVAGRGAARVGRKTVTLRRGSLLLIPKGTEHEVKNTGPRPLRTLNFYAAPAY